MLSSSSSHLGLQSIPSPLLLKSWPRPLTDEFASSSVEELPTTYEEIKSQVESLGDILIRVVTWNMQAKEAPSSVELEKHIFPSRRYHVIVVGSQACENSFVKSVIVPTKAKWEAVLEGALGTDYDALHSHSLQASHM